MGKAHTVQLRIGCLHFFGDPGPVAGLCSDSGALGNDLGKCTITGNFNRAVAEIPLEPSGDSKFTGKKHEPRVGVPPEQRVAVGIPRKDAKAVCGNESLRGEVAAYCQ